ncbi:MAG: site-specific DNA-methyltransferase [Candidatus Stahlbacteria bacterium]|nr:site-specific DNA-methyltransferase [Candidatus Stahlbacteria bacterium]
MQELVTTYQTIPHKEIFVKAETNFIDKVICGDCIEVMKSMPSNFVHLIVTSPPYNVGKSYENHYDKMPYQDYLDWLEQVWIECYRVLVKGGRICINVPSVTADGQYQPLFVDVVNQMRKFGYIMRGDILWYKQAISKRTAWGSWKSPSNPYVVQPYEFVLVFSKEQKKLDGDPEKIDITKNEFIEFSNSFWDIKPQTQPKGHPAPFPEKLIYRLVKFYSYIDNIVLDPFGGTGTVAVVSTKTKRRYIYIDNCREYCILAEKNLKDISIQLTLL